MIRLLLLALALSCALLAGNPGSGTVPLFFIPNHGQTPEPVRFMVKGSGLTAHLLPGEVRLRMAGLAVTLRFEGASPDQRIEGNRVLAGRANFLTGGTSDWHVDLPLFGAVIYRDLYPGIDLEYGGEGGNLKSEFHVAASADVSMIRVRYIGAGVPWVDDSGALVIPLEGGDANGQLRERAPLIYQDRAGVRHRVAGRYLVHPDGAVGFQLGDYDASLPLVIDPVLSYSTLLGGSGMESAMALAVDSSGSAYIAGFTDSMNFPATNPAQGFNGGGNDVFVAKLSPSGNSLIYCTYLGGSADDRAYGIAVDAQGAAYITGSTTSKNFPVRGAFQAKNAGYHNAFVAKLTPAGNSLVYSTYLGGNASDSANSIAVDASGAAYIVGDTTSFSFPASGFQRGTHGGQDAFLAKFSADGSQLIYSTYLGGSSEDHGAAIAVNSAGEAFVTGSTTSVDFPVLNAIQPSNAGGQDAFVARLSANGNYLLFSTYLGGSGGTTAYAEIGQDIALDGNGNAYVTGVTSSLDFPLLGALQTGRKGALDAFVTKLTPAGALVYSTFLGGSSIDLANGIAVDTAGAAYVVGYTISTDFPVANAVQSVNAGEYDAFLVRLSPAGDAVQYASYLGGNGSDSATAVALDSAANVYVAGYTLSTNFPLRNAYQASNGGNYGAFVSKVDFAGLRTSAVLSVAVTHAGSFVQGASGASYTIIVSNQAGALATAGTVTLTDTLPSGLILQGIAGTGWTCGGNSCTRADPLAGGASYPAITVTVSVSPSATSPQVNSVTASGGGSATATTTDSTPVTILPVWGISSAHAGSFLQGQGGTYTLTAWNVAGAGPSTGTVTVTQTLPAGLTPASMSGTGWTCGVTSCSRSDSLPAGTSYPPITATVNVALNAGSPLVNSITVSGGGAAATATATDSTTIAFVPVLGIAATHSGSFTQGQGGTFSLVVSNQTGAGTTTGTVTVTGTLPGGLTLTSMTGPGWTCGGNTCTRSDALTGGASYPTISVAVTISANAASPQIYSATVSGGGSVSANTTNSAPIALLPMLSVVVTHNGNFNQGQNGTYTVTVSNQSGVGATAGMVAVLETVPAGLTLVSMTGTGWACGGNSCTRSDALSGGGSFPAITVTVGVALNAPSPLVNSVTVSGGGSASATATDSIALSCGYQVSGNGVYGPLTATGTVAIAGQAGCAWSATANAAWLHITSAATGNGNGQVGYSVDANSTSTQRTGTLTIASQSFTVLQGGSVTQSGAGLRFVPATPCRIADTRNATGAYGGPAIGPGAGRDFAVLASACGIPATAQAYSLNLTVVPSGALDALYVWPTGQLQPPVANLSSTDGRIKADMAIIAAGTGGAISVAVSNTTHLIVDINGYFVAATGNADLAFYPVTPCRVVETRIGTGPLAGPNITGNQYRTFPVLSSPCSIPSTARAYSFNVTVVPGGVFGFLTIWPAGGPQPVVSTLNALTGAITANAAIVPAGTDGAITVITSHSTALIIDINGYFAPPGAGGLQFYPRTPCRIVDTHNPDGPFSGPPMAASSRRDFLVTGSSCAVPLTSTAYLLNATVAPITTMGFLSLWGTGGQPVVSTLNALDGATTMNSALVPAGSGGTISVFTSHPTHLLLDISGYFAP